MSNALFPLRLLAIRFFLVIAATISLCAHSAFADSWIQPTAEELKMTSEPTVPGASAIYLYRNESVNDKLHIHTLYVRLKVLTEKGMDYGDVELNYDQGRSFSIRAIEGRTIHSDGTVIPFTGKPYEKVLEKSKTLKYKAKVFFPSRRPGRQYSRISLCVVLRRSSGRLAAMVHAVAALCARGALRISAY